MAAYVLAKLRAAGDLIFDDCGQFAQRFDFFFNNQ